LLTTVLHAHDAARAEHQALNRRLEQLGRDHQALLARQADSRQAIAEWANLRRAGLLIDDPTNRLAALRSASHQHRPKTTPIRLSFSSVSTRRVGSPMKGTC